jgi:hemoglobin
MTPTLYEWMGGKPTISKMLDTFYGRVPSDPTLAPVFAGMSPAHAAHVADFIAEVFGGPKTYSVAEAPMPSWGWGEVKGPYVP